MLTRRGFLARFGGTAAATAAVYALPEILRVRGWWNAAYALEPNLVLDTYNAEGRPVSGSPQARNNAPKIFSEDRRCPLRGKTGKAALKHPFHPLD